MNQHTAGTNDCRRLVISFVLALACSCATTPSHEPIRAFKDVAGEWSGDACSTAGGTLVCVPVVITIMEDGSGYRIAINRREPIRCALVDGEIRVTNQVTGATSTIWLSIVGGNRVLMYHSDDGRWGQYHPVKKEDLK